MKHIETPVLELLHARFERESKTQAPRAYTAKAISRALEPNPFQLTQVLWSLSGRGALKRTSVHGQDAWQAHPDTLNWIQEESATFLRALTLLRDLSDWAFPEDEDAPPQFVELVTEIRTFLNDLGNTVPPRKGPPPADPLKENTQ